MPLLTILFVIIIVGDVLWLINSFIPMTSIIKNDPEYSGCDSTCCLAAKCIWSDQ